MEVPIVETSLLPEGTAGLKAVTRNVELNADTISMSVSLPTLDLKMGARSFWSFGIDPSV